MSVVVAIFVTSAPWIDEVLEHAYLPITNNLRPLQEKHNSKPSSVSFPKTRMGWNRLLFAVSDSDKKINPARPQPKRRPAGEK